MARDGIESTILRGYLLTRIDVIYFMPDFGSLLQEFSWQEWDDPAGFPRMSRFLDHWRRHVEATIKEVYLSTADPAAFGRFRKVDHSFRI